MSITALYIFDSLGKPLIFRNYRGAPQSDIVDKFLYVLSDKEEDKSLTPVLLVNETVCVYIKHNDLYIVATPNEKANVMLVFVFLFKLLEVMHDYFKAVNEESVRDNFVVIHELLDETLDFGYPQTTESKILMEYITQECKTLDNRRTVPSAVTNTVSWRSEGIRHRKNEVFFDVVESIYLMANFNGSVVRSEISGSIQVKSNLSGMPEVRLGLNDRLLLEKNSSESERFVDLDEVRFHQCVRLVKFETDRTICFIPPDGEFELMSYRLNTYIKPPIWVDCVTEYFPNSKIEYTVKATSHFKGRYTAVNVDILIPVPSDVDSPDFKSAAGTVAYLPEEDLIKWSLKSFPGSKEFFMTAKFGLPSVAGEDRESLPPIRVVFEIVFFTTSGIKVQYLKVYDKTGYTALPWIRYVTQNGDYQIRRKEVVHFRKSYKRRQ